MESMAPVTAAAAEDAGVLTLADQFRSGLTRAADGTALRFGQRAWTYAELHDQALRLAGMIVEATGGAPAAVGVLAVRTVECYAGTLAAVYAAATVVPLSPAFPAERTATMIEAAGVSVLIPDRFGAPTLPAALADGPDVQVVTIDPAAASAAATPVTVAPSRAAPLPMIPDSPAYIPSPRVRPTARRARPSPTPMAAFLEVNRRRYGKVDRKALRSRR